MPVKYHQAALSLQVPHDLRYAVLRWDTQQHSLTTKHGKYYVVVRVPDGTGDMKARWIPTGISSEGNNKRKAQQKRLEILAELEHDKDLVSGDMPFSTWLEAVDGDQT